MHQRLALQSSQQRWGVVEKLGGFSRKTVVLVGTSANVEVLGEARSDVVSPITAAVVSLVKPFVGKPTRLRRRFIGDDRSSLTYRFT